MLKGPFSATFALALTAFAGAASAAPPPAAPQQRPELLNRLIECRGIDDAAKRLACYDAQVSAIDTAEKKQDLVVMDRQQVRETRKSLFGFSLPKFSLGGRKLDDGDDIKEISSTVASVRRTANGWSITLDDDGSTWESNDLTSPPDVGNKVRIRKATMGSYLGKVGFSQSARFRRVN